MSHESLNSKSFMVYINISKVETKTPALKAKIGKLGFMRTRAIPLLQCIFNSPEQGVKRF